MAGYLLIVDDEFGLAELVAALLAERGYETALAINGKLALASLRARPADLVLADTMMPVLDGPGLVAAMRADDALRGIPIILMTALPELLPEMRAAGADAVLVKPFTLDQLLATMSTLLRTR